MFSFGELPPLLTVFNKLSLSPVLLIKADFDSMSVVGFFDSVLSNAAMKHDT